jgi:hypothetical protein
MEANHGSNDEVATVASNLNHEVEITSQKNQPTSNELADTQLSYKSQDELIEDAKTASNLHVGTELAYNSIDDLPEDDNPASNDHLGPQLSGKSMDNQIEAASTEHFDTQLCFNSLYHRLDETYIEGLKDLASGLGHQPLVEDLGVEDADAEAEEHDGPTKESVEPQWTIDADSLTFDFSSDPQLVEDTVYLCLVLEAAGI